MLSDEIYQSILENPLDPGSRLVFADAIEEEGFPTFGEWIRYLVWLERDGITPRQEPGALKWTGLPSSPEAWNMGVAAYNLWDDHTEQWIGWLCGKAKLRATFSRTAILIASEKLEFAWRGGLPSKVWLTSQAWEDNHLLLIRWPITDIHFTDLLSLSTRLVPGSWKREVQWGNLKPVRLELGTALEEAISGRWPGLKFTWSATNAQADTGQPG